MVCSHVVVAAPATADAAIGAITVESGPVGVTTTLGGTVVPLREVSFAAQMPGRVVFIAGIEGDWFKEGSVLIALDDEDLQAKRNQALAALSTAESTLRNAHVQYSRQVYTGSNMADNMGMRIPKLVDRYFTEPMSRMTGTDNPELSRRAEIFNQGTLIDQALFTRQQVIGQLQELDAKLRDLRSVAPFSGVIIRKSIEVGDTVQPGMPMVTFADTRTLQIKVDVPARLMGGIQRGMIIPAKLDVGNMRVETRVAQIYPMADPQRHTVTMKLDLPVDAPGGPGMYAEVTIPDSSMPMESLPVIPKSAVLWRGSLPGVMVVADGRDPELRMVRLGGFVDERSVSVLSGLRAGERIAANPNAVLPSGWSSSGAMQPAMGGDLSLPKVQQR
ncbi:MAG: efflux RND transporter periplasmic adaptor subunit [Magnetococcales bacterium]|nr:efflux RND transporter periplasmic adaptor subunit [Magnetococcales bacterium]